MERGAGTPPSSPSRPMLVSAKWSRRKFEALELDPRQPTAVFKEQLSTLTGVEPHNQKIMVKGAIVADDADWSGYRLKAGMTLVMMGTPAKRRVSPPEVWSVLPHAWRSHGLEGCLTPLQAALLRLAAAGLTHARLGADARSTFVAEDCDVFERMCGMIVSTAKAFAYEPAGAVARLRRGEPADPFASGVLHDIATEGGREEWTNPHAAGRVNVSASSEAAGCDLSRYDHFQMLVSMMHP